MKLTKEYIAENEDVVFRNYNQIDGNRKSQEVQNRIKIINNFCKGAKTILSVGCGPYDPIDGHATHAIDIIKTSETYLRKQGWKGEFKLGSCDEIPYPNKSFDAAYCQEVIEHLPDLEIVKKTFQELNRVARRWIVSCPTIRGSEITHKRAFDQKMLELVTEGLQRVKIEKKRYWYVLHTGN